jgi:hypothetical protein
VVNVLGAPKGSGPTAAALSYIEVANVTVGGTGPPEDVNVAEKTGGAGDVKAKDESAASTVIEPPPMEV